MARVVFEVLEQSRGPKMQRVSVQFNPGGTSCDLEELSFEQGEVFLISAKLPGPSISVLEPHYVFSNNYCDLRERLQKSYETRTP